MTKSSSWHVYSQGKKSIFGVLDQMFVPAIMAKVTESQTRVIFTVHILFFIMMLSLNDHSKLMYLLIYITFDPHQSACFNDIENGDPHCIKTKLYIIQ